MIRVFLVDDDTILRQGLKLLLAQDSGLEVIGEASHGQEAILRTGELKPNVILMDLEMPVMGGIEATKQIRKRFPDVNVVMLTSHDSQACLFDALEAGAAGYVLKRADVSEIISAIRSAEEGLAYLSPMMTKFLIREHLSAGTDTRVLKELSPREEEVFRLLAEGKINQEIANQLSISLVTVQTHRSHIMEKLSLRTRTDLVKYAIRKGIISVNDEKT